MKTKLMTLQDATGFFRDGMTIMVGGFMGIGTPSRLVEALLESGGVEFYSSVKRWEGCCHEFQL